MYYTCKCSANKTLKEHRWKQEITAWVIHYQPHTLSNIAYKHLLKIICTPWAADPNLKHDLLANLVGCVLHACNEFDTLNRFNEVKMCLTRPAQRNRCLISDTSKTECLYNYTMEHDVSSYHHFSGFRNTTVSSHNRMLPTASLMTNEHVLDWNCEYKFHKRHMADKRTIRSFNKSIGFCSGGAMGYPWKHSPTLHYNILSASTIPDKPSHCEHGSCRFVKSDDTPLGLSCLWFVSELPAGGIRM